MANEDKSTRYHRLKRRASVGGAAAGGAMLVLLLVTGASAALRDAARAWAGEPFALAAIVYVVAIALFNEAVQLPVAFYTGVTLERRYGLATQTTGRWWADHLKASAIGMAFAVVGALAVMTVMRWWPGYWWAAAALMFSAFLVLLAQVAPVLLLPLFYRVVPLDRPALADRLVALADRAGARVLGVFEWRLSDRTRKANAALTGIGRTRRILLSDTLLAAHSDDEIEVVLAHELAHHVHRDIQAALLVEVVLIFGGFWAADALLRLSTGWFGLRGVGDIAALPLLVLAAAAVSLAMLPLANALSRAHERRADAYALDLTRNAEAFITAMRRLATQNLAEEQPSRLVQIFFHGHPSTAERIAAAETWRRSQSAGV